MPATDSSPVLSQQVPQNPAVGKGMRKMQPGMWGMLLRLLGFDVSIIEVSFFFLDDLPAPGCRLAGRRGGDVQFCDISDALIPSARVPK